MSASRPSSALKDRRPATSMGFAPTSRPSSAAKDRASSNSGADPSLPPALAPINPSHLRPMSAFSQISLSSRPGSAMSRSTFGGSRLVVLDSLTEGPGTFQGARRRPATSEGLGRPSTAIGGRAGAVASATPLRRWAEGFGSDSDSPGAASEGESTMGGRGADAASTSLLGEEAGAEDFTMEPKLSPRAAIAMEKRLWKARHSLNSLPAPSHVMSRLFGTDEQWRYAQQHPKDTPANAPLPLQPLDYREVTKIELDPACSARADLSGITMQQLASLKLMFEHACHQSRASLDVAKSDRVSQIPNALSLDEFCNFLLDATGSSHAASSLLFRRADYDSKNAITWDDVLPHILKKHSTEKASKRDIPYSINMLRADPELSHQKDQVACMVVCPLQRMLCTLGMVSRVVMFWPLPTLKQSSGSPISAFHVKFAHELVQGIALGSTSKMPGSVDHDGEDDAAQASFVTPRSMCYVSSREGDLWVVMGHECIIHLLNVKKREHKLALITAPEIASLVATSGAFDDNDPNLIMCVGCESGCILLYDPKSVRQDTKPFRRLEASSHVPHSMRSSSSLATFITEGGSPTAAVSSAAMSPGAASSLGWGSGSIKREVGVAVTHMCRWPNVGVFVALARGSIQVYDQQRWTLQRTLDFHTDTLVGMCIDVLHKVIITASKDRRLLLWDPFIDKPISEVHTHSAPYVSMLFLQSQQLLVTVGADKIVEIWHLQTMSSVMRFTDDFRHKGINRLSAAAWDPIHSVIFTAGNTIRRLTVNAVEQALRKRKAKTGAVNAMDNASMLEVSEGAGLGQPIVAVLFTSMLGQLIVVSNVECRVIEAQSGSTLTTFSLKAYGRCSCACLDVCGRRLMTGSETGIVCMWEYSLGRLLKIVNRMPPTLKIVGAPTATERVEISCICCVAQANLTVRPLVVGDWSHNLVMCSDSTDAVVEDQPALLQGHRHDVLCVVSCGNFLVSGDANGLALVWFILNGHRRHSIQVTKSEGGVGLSGTSINCGVWIGSAHLCYLGTSEGEIVGVNPVLGQIKSRIFLTETPSVSCVAQGSIWSSENGRQFQLVTGTTDGSIFFFHVPVMDLNAVALANVTRSKMSSSQRLADSVRSNAESLLQTKGTKLQMLSRDYVPQLEMHTNCIAHQNTVAAVVIAEISGITVSASTDGGLRLWSWTGKPLCVVGTSTPWPYWEISNQSNQELISQEIERMEREKQEEIEYERLAKLKEAQDAKNHAARLHRQWCVDLAKSSSGVGLLPLSESVEIFKFLDESPRKSENAKKEDDGKPKSALLVPSSMSYRPIDAIDHICASLLKKNRLAVQEITRANEEESRLGRIFMQLETALTQSEDPRDAEELKILEEKLKILKHGVNSEECAGIEKGRLPDPPQHPFCEMNIDDLVPPALGHKALKGKLESLIELLEVLNRNCVLIKECFRAYCAIAANDIERFFTLSRTDFARFCKDTRCPRHVLTKTEAIFRTVEPHSAAKYKSKGPGRELILSEFVELLVRVSNVCYPNRTTLGKKMALFSDKHLNYALRHRPDKFHTLVSQPEIAPSSYFVAAASRSDNTCQVFKKICAEQNQSGETDIVGFCNLCQRAGLIDHVMTVQRAASMFVYCNYEQETPTSGWEEWDWNLTFGEFNQGILRIADLKLTNSQEKALQMRLDLFMKAQPFKEYLATKYFSDRFGSSIKTNRLHLHEQQAQF